MTFQQYLQINLAPATQKIYLFEINHFINFFGQQKADHARYQDIIQYLHFLRTRYDNPKTINRILQAIKLYFFFLMESGYTRRSPLSIFKPQRSGPSSNPTTRFI